jgi:hypothetical protein
MGFLDNIPVASITFIVGTALAVVAYVSNDLSIQDTFAAIGYVGGGSGIIGLARNGAGRGVR